MFDVALDSTASPRRAGTLATSTVLHGLLAGSLFVGPLWTIREPPEPPERMAAFLPTVPMERLVKSVDAPRGTPDGGAPNAPTRAPRRAAVVQPRDIPSEAPVASSAPAFEVDDAIPFGAPGEQASPGIGPGLVAGPAGDPDGRIAADEILPANAPEVTPPVPLVTTAPAYPDALLRARIQGVTILEAIIDVDGSVRSARVLRGGNPLLEAAATKAILSWRYRPARVGARPVAVYLTVTVKFGIV
jgi:protein TonB